MRHAEARINALLVQNQLANYQASLRRIPVSHEEGLLASIRLGDVDGIHFPPFSTIEEHGGKSVERSEKFCEYTAVEAITLGCRAAIEGGLASETAYDISDAALGCLAAADGPAEMHEVLEAALRIMARSVRDNRRRQSTYAVEQACLYVSRNLFERIRLDDVARFVGVSPSYLSSHFSKQTGYSLSQYIQKERVAAACGFLSNSTMSISLIAQNVGYQSQSAFSKVFRIWTGTSPLAYRNAHRRDVFHG